MTFGEMDNCFIRAIRQLHSISSESQHNLRAVLDEAIKNKYGPGKEISQFVNFSSMFQEYPVMKSDPHSTEIEKDDGKASSDNELELDLLKEDLMCVICKGMGVGARNRLVECCECNSLYHQECHEPGITEEEIESNSFWTCFSCKEASKLVRKNCATSSPLVAHKAGLIGGGAGTISPAPRAFADKELAQVNQLCVSHRFTSPNINVIGTEKRLQTIKKRAAKLQEKRKISR